MSRSNFIRANEIRFLVNGIVSVTDANELFVEPVHLPGGHERPKSADRLASYFDSFM